MTPIKINASQLVERWFKPNDESKFKNGTPNCYISDAAILLPEKFVNLLFKKSSDA